MTTPNLPPHDDSYEQWLVVRAQAGEEQAMTELVERWAPALARHAMRFTQDADGARDVAQEAWLAIVKGIDRLDDPACFRRWAYRIVERRSVDWVRRRVRRRESTQPLAEDPTAPETDSAAADRVEQVRRVLRQLPDRDRVLLAMHYADQMPLSEIADAAGLPVGTVKSRLHHARQRLKQAIQRDRRDS